MGGIEEGAINTAFSAMEMGILLDMHSAITPSPEMFQDLTLIQPQIIDHYLLVILNMEGTTSIVIISMISLLVAIVLVVCCHACR